MKLVFHTSNDGVQEFEIHKSSVLIGRGSTCDVILKVEGISRQHCRIDLTPKGDFLITDLGSTNGVLIDNVRLVPNQPVAYKTYLPLQIGSVPHVTLEAQATVQEERVIVAHDRDINIELDLPNRQKKSSSRGSKAKTNAKGKIQVEKQPPWGLILLVVLAIAGFTYFFFLGQTGV